MWAIQVAVRDALLDDNDIAQAVTGVYDYVPETAAMPYITVGEATETSDNTHNTFGHQTTVTLHIWTRQRGHKQGLELLQQVKKVLDRQPLDIDGRHTVLIRHEFTQTLRDPDPEVRHIPARFRVITQEV
jgi:peptidoglycan/xylan/chitin deacetylase (PgdA/CDA1 family)